MQCPYLIYFIWDFYIVKKYIFKERKKEAKHNIKNHTHIMGWPFVMQNFGDILIIIIIHKLLKLEHNTENITEACCRTHQDIIVYCRGACIPPRIPSIQHFHVNCYMLLCSADWGLSYNICSNFACYAFDLMFWQVCHTENLV